MRRIKNGSKVMKPGLATFTRISGLLEARRDVLAHAGDDCSEYDAITSALRAGTATPSQVRSYLLGDETQRRLNSSGSGVDRWGHLVLEWELCP
jgi:hypothetical protein